jgi:hypothetical protein
MAMVKKTPVRGDGEMNEYQEAKGNIDNDRKVMGRAITPLQQFNQNQVQYATFVSINPVLEFIKHNLCCCLLAAV